MTHYLTRTKIKSVKCPYCEALPSEKCIGKRGLREAVHKERVDAYVARHDW